MSIAKSSLVAIDLDTLSDATTRTAVCDYVDTYLQRDTIRIVHVTPGQGADHESVRGGTGKEGAVLTVDSLAALATLAESLNVAPADVYYFGADALGALGHGYCTALLDPKHVDSTTYRKVRNAGALSKLFVPSSACTKDAFAAGCRWFELLEAEGFDSPLPAQLGAVPLSATRTHFRVWSPRKKEISVVTVDGQRFPLQRHANGYHTQVIPISVDTDYELSIEGNVQRPDPTSRFQPHGVHRGSRICSEHRYPWRDAAWKGVAKEDLVIYEMHLGSFTNGGTYLSAIERLPELVELGVTAIELLPVAQSPGQWNWGYDGVNLYAPRSSFGLPDDFRYFVDSCHEHGLAVLLDVVYNHLGPEGNYLRDFAPYFTRKYNTPWGEALDFDGRQQEHVRRFIVENAVYWLKEFHLDGLRLDAVHFMFDDQDHTILDAVRDGVEQLRSKVERPLHLIAEANVYDHDLVVGAEGKPPYDAAWSDDMMHSIYAIGVDGLALTPRSYDAGDDLETALKHGFVYYYPTITKADDAQRAAWFAEGDRRYVGSLITALQTHDSVGNHPHGKRIHQLASVDFQKAAAALMLLYPSIPMIFMGEEIASESPFPFFVDFEDERLRRAVDKGRANEYPQHAWDGALSPSDPRAFFHTKCLPDSSADESVREWYRALLEFRRQQREKGVLDWRNLTVTTDTEASVYSISYQSDQGGFAVHARLKPHSRELAHEVSLDAQPVQLCSRGILTPRESLRLKPNHAAICHR